MSNGQSPAEQMGMKLTNAYGMLESIRQNLPGEPIGEEWVIRYNTALAEVNSDIGGLDSFLIPESYLQTIKWSGESASTERYVLQREQFLMMLDGALHSIRLRLPEEAVRRIGYETPR